MAARPSGKKEVTQPACVSLGLLRAFVGFALADAGADKWMRQFGGADLSRIIQEWLPKVNWVWYRQFLNDTVLANADAYAHLVTLGEIVVGFCLLIGFFARPVAVVAMFMNLNYLLAASAAPASVGYNRLMLVCEFLIIAGAAGRYVGLDAFFHRKFPKNQLW